jgi:hypothetical protein
MTLLNLSLGTPVVRVAETTTGEMGVVGARFIMAGGPSEGRFSLVEDPIVPRGARRPSPSPHARGRVLVRAGGPLGFQQGADVRFAELGDLSTSRATCGTPPGTPPTSRLDYWRSSRPRASSSCPSSSPICCGPTGQP